MALFPNVEGGYSFGGKTHNNLVVSEGVAPAEKWIVSKNNEFKPFVYEFGPEGNQTVVLPKGKIVELGEAEYDPQTGREVSTIKMAGEGSKKAVGVLHHNVYQTRRGRFSGNDQPNPVVLTRQYIEVPLFEHDNEATANTAAKAIKFGAAYGGKDKGLIQPGDFVKVGEDGNFVKLDIDGGDSPFQIVGQALAVERELPPAGFLQYYMGGEVPELEAFMKAQGYAPSPGSNGADAGAFPMGSPYSPGSWKADFAKKLGLDIDKGIPFLTDGYFKAKEKVTAKINDIYDAEGENAGHIESVRVAGNIEIAEGTATAVVAKGSKNNAVFIKLRHAIDKTEADHVSVSSDGVKLAATDVHVDYAQNVIVVYLEEDKTYTDLAVTANLIVNPVAGIPTEWDYAGSVGAVRILLQR